MHHESLGPTLHWPCLTADLPGIGGTIKLRPEDFLVDEIPLYEPSDTGTHLYLHVEKRGITTLEAIRRIARTAGKTPRQIGYAGLKDSDAVTRQTFSVEHTDPDRFRNVDLGSLRILDIRRHTNKLKLGHLQGNHFVIKVRDHRPADLPHAHRIIDTLIRRGMPNYFGPQRFGARGDNGFIGRAIIRGDYQAAVDIMLGQPGPRDHGDILLARKLFDQGRLPQAAVTWPESCRQQRQLSRALLKTAGNPRQAWTAIDAGLRRLLLSACQSQLFNNVLARRIDQLDRLQQGDMAYKHRNGACFRVEDPLVEQPRCDALEISPTGPVYGKRMTEATGQPGRLEAQILDDAGLQRADFRTINGVKLDGARRPLRVPLGNLDLDHGNDDHGPFVRLDFSLPKGSYATCLTRELCKTDRTLPSRASRCPDVSGR